MENFQYITLIAYQIFRHTGYYAQYTEIITNDYFLYRTKFYQNFGWNINSVDRKEDASKSIVSHTGICPVPSYRATYKIKHYNIQNFQDLSRVERWNKKEPAITIDNWLRN